LTLSDEIWCANENVGQERVSRGQARPRPKGRGKVIFGTQIVASVAIYASETWKMTTKIAQKLNVFHQGCLRKILHVTYRDHITNEEVLLRTVSRKFADILTSIF